MDFVFRLKENEYSSGNSELGNPETWWLCLFITYLHNATILFYLIWVGGILRQTAIVVILCVCLSGWSPSNSSFLRPHKPTKTFLAPNNIIDVINHPMPLCTSLQHGMFDLDKKKSTSVSPAFSLSSNNLSRCTLQTNDLQTEIGPVHYFLPLPQYLPLCRSPTKNTVAQFWSHLRHI